MDSCNRKKPPSAPKRTNSRKIMQNYKPQVEERSNECSEVETCADTLHNTATDFLHFLDRLEEVKATGNSQDLLKFIATDGRKKGGNSSKVREKQHLFQGGGSPIKKTQSFAARRSLPAENKRERSKTQTPMKIIEEAKNKNAASKARLAAKRERSKTTTPIKSAKVFNVSESKTVTLILDEDKASVSKNKPIDMKEKSSFKEKESTGSKLIKTDKFTSAINKQSQKNEKSCFPKISPRNSSSVKYRLRTGKTGSKCLKNIDETSKLYKSYDLIKIEKSDLKGVSTENLKKDSNFSEHKDISNGSSFVSNVNSSNSILETSDEPDSETDKKLDNICISKLELESLNSSENVKSDNVIVCDGKLTPETSPKLPDANLVCNKNDSTLIKSCSPSSSSETELDKIDEKETPDLLSLSNFEDLDKKCDQKPEIKENKKTSLLSSFSNVNDPLDNKDVCSSKEKQVLNNQFSSDKSFKSDSYLEPSETPSNIALQRIATQNSCKKCEENRGSYQDKSKVKSTEYGSFSDSPLSTNTPKSSITETSSEILECNNVSLKEINDNDLTNTVIPKPVDENKTSSKVINDNTLSDLGLNNIISSKTKTNIINKTNSYTYNNVLSKNTEDCTKNAPTTKKHDDKKRFTTQKQNTKKLSSVSVGSLTNKLNGNRKNNESVKLEKKPLIPPKPKLAPKPKLDLKQKLTLKPKVPIKPKDLVSSHSSLETKQSNKSNIVQNSSFVEMFSKTEESSSIKKDEQVNNDSENKRTNLLSSFSYLNDPLSNSDVSSSNADLQEENNQVDSVGQLNKQIENAKVKSIAVTPKMSENINSRMEKYSMSSNKNKEKQTSTQISITKNVSDTKNKWKSGEVYKKEEKKKIPNKAILGASLNKRKNIFENGKNQSQPTTTKQVAVGGISNRKELYLKQAEDKKENKDSSQSHANKSSKLKQLDKWESGQVTSAKSPNKVAISISSSGLKDKMNKYKSLTQEN